VEKTLLGVHDSSVSSKKTIRKGKQKSSMVVYGGMKRRLRKAGKGIYSVTPLGVKRPLSTLVAFHLLDDGEEPMRLFVEDWKV